MLKYTGLFLALLFSATSCGQKDSATVEGMNDNRDIERRDLTPEEERVIVNKGTERPFTGEYWDHYEKGTYHCRWCDAPLYRSSDKFEGHCGWPAFDDEIEGAVSRQTDADGRRTEILCANCGGHLGHVFEGEGFTDKDIRHCVNSISMVFKAENEAESGSQQDLDTAIYASGCFWGTEYFLKRKEGVVSTEVGYIGGHVDSPTYEQVCTGKTGHAEATRVVFDPSKVSYEELTKLFFETHDPTQQERQGPDIGNQYRSGVFYLNEEQKEVAQKLKATLIDKGLDVKTEITEASTFWPAENYHQDYYDNKGGTPYCHGYTKRFD